MIMESEIIKIVRLPKHSDIRGSLCVADNDNLLPFVPSRVFWITDVPADARRGGHAHWTCSEIVFAASGSFEIELDDGEACETYRLNEPNVGVLVPAGVWCELREFTEDSVCLVFASEKYDASGYVHDKSEWKSAARTHCGNKEII